MERQTWRNTLGMTLAALLSLATAIAALVSPFLDWYGGRDGRDYRLSDLFSSDGISADSASLFTGLFLPLLAAALLALLAVPLRSATLMALAGLLVLGTTILWMVRQYQANDSLTIGQGGLGEGVACALVGGVLGLLAAATAFGRGRGRHRRSRGRDRDRERDRERDEAEEREEHGGHVVTGPWGEEGAEPHPGRRRWYGRRHDRDAA